MTDYSVLCEDNALVEKTNRFKLEMEDT